MRISSSDVKVEVNYPEQYELDEEIEKIIAKWIFNQQIDRYGEDKLKLAYPLWISYKGKQLKI